MLFFASPGSVVADRVEEELELRVAEPERVDEDIGFGPTETADVAFVEAEEVALLLVCAAVLDTTELLVCTLELERADDVVNCAAFEVEDVESALVTETEVELCAELDETLEVEALLAVVVLRDVVDLEVASTAAVVEELDTMFLEVEEVLCLVVLEVEVLFVVLVVDSLTGAVEEEATLLLATLRVEVEDTSRFVVSATRRVLKADVEVDAALFVVVSLAAAAFAVAALEATV